MNAYDPTALVDEDDGLDPPQWAWDIFDQHALWDRAYDYTPLARILLSDTSKLLRDIYRQVEGHDVFSSESLTRLDDALVKIRDVKRLAA